MPKKKKERIWPEGKIIRHILSYYVHVGQMTKDKAEAHMDKIREHAGWQSIVNQLESQGVAAICVPVRMADTQFELSPSLHEDEDDGEDFEIVLDGPEAVEYEDEEVAGAWVDDLRSVPGVEVEMEDEE